MPNRTQHFGAFRMALRRGLEWRDNAPIKAKLKDRMEFIWVWVWGCMCTHACKWSMSANFLHYFLPYLLEIESLELTNWWSWLVSKLQGSACFLVLGWDACHQAQFTQVLWILTQAFTEQLSHLPSPSRGSFSRKAASWVKLVTNYPCN